MSVEIETPGHASNEKIHAQVMWSKTLLNESYYAGLKVIAEGNETIDSDKELVCSHCGEAIFILKIKLKTNHLLQHTVVVAAVIVIT